MGGFLCIRYCFLVFFTLSRNGRIVSSEDVKYLDVWLETAHGMTDTRTAFDIYVDVGGDLITLDSYQSDMSPVPEKYPHWQVDETSNVPLRIGVDQPGESTGVLSGKAIYLSQCHGWDYFESLEVIFNSAGRITQHC